MKLKLMLYNSSLLNNKDSNYKTINRYKILINRI